MQAYFFQLFFQLFIPGMILNVFALTSVSTSITVACQALQGGSHYAGVYGLRVLEWPISETLESHGVLLPAVQQAASWCLATCTVSEAT